MWKTTSWLLRLLGLRHHVNIHIGDSAFSFMEQVGYGTVQTTTITRDGLAVHSRNTVLLGEIVAAQHFGRCVPD